MAQKSGNPWAMRIGVIGLVCILIGSITLLFNTDSIDDAWNPKKISEVSITGDGAVIGDFSKSCFSAISIDDDFGNVSLLKISGSGTQGEPLSSSSCKTDWQPMDSGGDEFVILKEWEIDESGEYALEVTCDVPCENNTVWLVDATNAQWNILDELGVIIAGSICCLGVIMLPTAFILYQTNKRNKTTTVMMVGKSGQMIPLTDLTPENVARIGQNGEFVDNPFADTGITESEEFIDGREDVQNGTLLTTEQVFALMKGDVDEAQNRVSDPFADYNQVKINEKIQKETNTKEIASWDEGGDSPQHVEKTRNKKIIDKSTMVSEEKPKTKSNAWKDWDEY